MIVKVHLILTEGNSHLTIRESDGLLIHHITRINNREFKELRTAHLYFTTDDKPNKGDFYICPNNLLRRCGNSFEIGGRKVMASTSEFLGMHLIPTKFQIYYCQSPVEYATLEYNSNDITEEIEIDYFSTEASLSSTILTDVSNDEPIELVYRETEEATYTLTELIGNREGGLDEFLLNAPEYTQEEREVIMDGVSAWLDTIKK